MQTDKEGFPVVIKRLDQKNIKADYDEKQSIAYITYSGELSASDSDAAYAWLNQLIEIISTKSLYGEVFDFRGVKSFSTENLIDARKNSRKMNIMINTQDFPVAMIVANDMQEQILRGPMRVMEENPRKRIVKTTDDALAFLNEWHSQART
jgi:hypothetical protein